MPICIILALIVRDSRILDLWADPDQICTLRYAYNVGLDLMEFKDQF